MYISHLTNDVLRNTDQYPSTTKKHVQYVLCSLFPDMSSEVLDHHGFSHANRYETASDFMMENLPSWLGPLWMAPPIGSTVVRAADSDVTNNDITRERCVNA